MSEGGSQRIGRAGNLPDLLEILKQRMGWKDAFFIQNTCTHNEYFVYHEGSMVHSMTVKKDGDKFELEIISKPYPLL